MKRMKRWAYLAGVLLMMLIVGCVKQGEKQEAWGIEWVEENGGYGIYLQHSAQLLEITFSGLLEETRIKTINGETLSLTFQRAGDTHLLLGKKSGSFGAGERLLKITGTMPSIRKVEKVQDWETQATVAGKERAECAAPVLLGDITEDGVVNLLDFSLFVQAYGTTAGQESYAIQADIYPASQAFGGAWSDIWSCAQPDGIINLLDFGTFVNNYGKTAPDSWETVYGHPDQPDQVSDAIWYQGNGGGTISIGKTYTADNGWDIFVIRTDKEGNQNWLRTYGGRKDDEGVRILEIGTEGFILMGNTESSTLGERDTTHGGADIWLARIDYNGDLVWSRFFGGEGNDYGNGLSYGWETGEFVITGKTNSYGGNLTGTAPKGDYDAWVFRINANSAEPDILESGRYGGERYDAFFDYGYRYDSEAGETVVDYLVGETASPLPDSGYHPGTGGAVTTDFWVMQPLDGTLSSYRVAHYCYGGSGNECYSRGFAGEEGYVLAGRTWSDDGDMGIGSGDPGRSLSDSDWFLSCINPRLSTKTKWRIKGSDMGGYENAVGIVAGNKYARSKGYTAILTTYPSSSDPEDILNYSNYYLYIDSEGIVTGLKNAGIQQTRYKSIYYNEEVEEKFLLSGDTMQNMRNRDTILDSNIYLGALWDLYGGNVDFNLAPIVRKKPGSFQGGIITVHYEVAAATFQWEGYDPDGTVKTYYYKKDSAPYRSLSGSTTKYKWDNLSFGKHTFKIVAEDNEGALSEAVTWVFEVVDDYSLQAVVRQTKRSDYPRPGK